MNSFFVSFLPITFNPKSPKTEPSPKKTQTLNADPDTEPLSQAVITSHTYQESADSDDQSVETSVEVPNDDEYVDITRILMSTSIETETARGARSSSLNL